MSENITAFIDGLITYDYIFFSSVFALFILLVVLAIILRKKIILAIFLLLFSFLVLTLGSRYGYIKIHENVFKNSTKLLSQKQLSFTPAVVVRGSISNESKVDFSTCKITASAYKVSSNIIKKYIYPLKPLRKMSILQKNILKGQTQEFKIIIEPFHYTKEYNISIKASCK